MTDGRRAGVPGTARRQAPWLVLALLPGALTIYLAFHAGGYFAGEPAAAATVLLLVLAGLIVLAPDPAAGIGRGLIAAAAALGLFALWTLVSGSWSDAPGRALVEFDRALLYLLALVVFGSLPGGGGRLRWMLRGIALAAVAICAASLTTRVLPGVWPIEYESITTRLSYPVTYWNALGLLAALGVILCVGMTSSEREPPLVRVLACAAIPLLASTLLLTLSRGSILAVIVGVVVVAVVGHSRALVSGLAAAVPATLVAVVFTYRADLLVSDDPLSAAARDQGETVAIVVALCILGAALLRALLLRLDDVVAGVNVTREARRRVLTAGCVAIALGLIVTAVAVDLPGQYDRLVNPETTKATTVVATDGRGRLRDLSDASNRVRLDGWRVAYREFERAPLRGSGAGTFEITWNQHRPAFKLMRDGHSLYLEVLGELGLVGLALIVAALLTILGGIALRARGPDRATYATVLAAGVAWALVAGIDWHWEMAVVTLWFFALGGAALARDGDRGGTRRRIPPFWLRCALAAGCCLLALAGPLRVAVSQDRLETSIDAFLVGRCDVADDAARTALRAVGSRPQPYEVMAYCALVDGDRALAVRRMQQAQRRDPQSWRLAYGLARMQAMAGRDPRRAARDALRLNPLEPLTRDAVKRFRGQQRPAQWKRAARGMEILLPEA